MSGELATSRSSSRVWRMDLSPVSRLKMLCMLSCHATSLADTAAGSSSLILMSSCPPSLVRVSPEIPAVSFSNSTLTFGPRILWASATAAVFSVSEIWRAVAGSYCIERLNRSP